MIEYFLRTNSLIWLFMKHTIDQIKQILILKHTVLIFLLKCTPPTFLKLLMDCIESRKEFFTQAQIISLIILAFRNIRVVAVKDNSWHSKDALCYRALLNTRLDE